MYVYFLLLGPVPKISPVPVEILLAIKMNCRKLLRGTTELINSYFEARKNGNVNLSDFTAALSSSAASSMNSSKPLSNYMVKKINKSTFDMTSSTVLLSYRMIKLKVEILNIVSLFPVGSLKWPNAAKTAPTDVDNMEISTTETNKDEIQEGDITTTACDTNKNCDDVVEDSEGVEKELDDNSEADSEVSDIENNTEKDTEAYHVATNTFVAKVQEASTAYQLMDLLVELEKAMPNTALLRYEYKACSSNEIILTSTVAHRLFSLDRAIRYEDIKLDVARHSGVDFIPRKDYTPRCILTPQCTKPLCHSGKCSQGIEGQSRYYKLLNVKPDIVSFSKPEVTQKECHITADMKPQQSFPPVFQVQNPYTMNIMNNTQLMSLMASGQIVGFGYMPQAPKPITSYHSSYQQYLNNTSNNQVKVHDYNNDMDVDLDGIVPYVPRENELTDTAWI
jgi:hypothetical protein